MRFELCVSVFVLLALLVLFSGVGDIIRIG